MSTLERAAPLCPVRTARPVLVIIGPSGGGKSTVVRTLAGRGVVRVHPTWTTRPRRADEAGGSPEHRFVSDEEFDDLCARGFFLDTVSLFGLPYRYGLPALDTAEDGPLDAVMLRAPLVGRFTAVFPHHLVYQIEDLPDRLEARLRERETAPADRTARLSDNVREVDSGRLVAHRVFVNSGSLEGLADAVSIALRKDLA